MLGGLYVPPTITFIMHFMLLMVGGDSSLPFFFEWFFLGMTMHERYDFMHIMVIMLVVQQLVL